MTGHHEIGVPSAVGNAIVAVGDYHGESTMAIWHTDQHGNPTGAWIVPTDEAFGDRHGARAVLARLERRPITAESDTALTAVLDRLCTVADIGLTLNSCRPRTFSLLDAVEDTLARRTAVDDLVERMRAGRPGITPVEWQRGGGLTTPPRDAEELHRAAAVRGSGASAVAAEALGVTFTLRWIAGLWAETGAAVQRRPYLAAALDPVTERPPRWSAAARAAASCAFPLPAPPTHDSRRSTP